MLSLQKNYDDLSGRAAPWLRIAMVDLIMRARLNRPESKLAQLEALVFHAQRIVGHWEVANELAQQVRGI